MRCVLSNFFDLFLIVVGDERLVAIEFTESLDWLDGIGVDDLVPDEVLAVFCWQVLDELVDRVELLHAGNIKAAAQVVEGFNNGRIAVDLHRIVRLHPRKMLAEPGIVFPEFGMINDEQGGAVSFRKVEQGLFIHGLNGIRWGCPGATGWRKDSGRIWRSRCLCRFGVPACGCQCDRRTAQGSPCRFAGRSQRPSWPPLPARWHRFALQAALASEPDSPARAALR